MVTVNGQFPGPRIVAREGDRLLIKVVNHVQNNISIHWYKLFMFQELYVIKETKHNLYLEISCVNKINFLIS